MDNDILAGIALIVIALGASLLSGCPEAHQAPLRDQRHPHAEMGDGGSCQTCHTYEHGRLIFPDVSMGDGGVP